MKKTSAFALLAISLLALSACGTVPSAPVFATDNAASGTTTMQAQAVTGMPSIATISYWQPAAYDTLPANSIALINPNNGMLDKYGNLNVSAATISTYKTIAQKATARGVKLLAYVPTGYGLRDPNQNNDQGSSGQSMAVIKKQIDTYIAKIGLTNLYGIFFDETSQTCASAKIDYAALSKYVRSKGLKTSAWNPGWVGDNYCFVNATPSGDIVVTFESDLNTYLTDQWLPADLAEGNRLAHQRGAKTWNLIHTAVGSTGLKQALDSLRTRKPDYAYVTDIGGNWQAGEDTWGSPPSYWTAEKNCLVNGVCP